MKRSEALPVIGAMLANLAIAAAKLIAAYASGSSVMFSEGIHSVVDTGNEVLLLVGLRRSEKKPDAMHPFGYGKEVYFWGLVVALLLFGLGGGLAIYEGIHRLHDPRPQGDPGWSYFVLFVSLCAEATSWTLAARALRAEQKTVPLLGWVKQSKDPSAFVVFGEDSAAMIGIVIAALGVGIGQWTGSTVPDAVASLAVGALLCGTAAYLAVEIKALLIGESADQELVQAIQALSCDAPLVAHVSTPLTMHFGPQSVLVTIDLDLHTENVTARELVAAIDELEQRIRTRFPVVKRVYISPRPQRAAPADKLA